MATDRLTDKQSEKQTDGVARRIKPFSLSHLYSAFRFADTEALELRSRNVGAASVSVIGVNTKLDLHTRPHSIILASCKPDRKPGRKQVESMPKASCQLA